MWGKRQKEFSTFFIQFFLSFLSSDDWFPLSLLFSRERAHCLTTVTMVLVHFERKIFDENRQRLWVCEYTWACVALQLGRCCVSISLFLHVTSLLMLLSLQWHIYIASHGSSLHCLLVVPSTCMMESAREQKLCILFNRYAEIWIHDHPFSSPSSFRAPGVSLLDKEVLDKEALDKEALDKEGAGIKERCFTLPPSHVWTDVFTCYLFFPFMTGKKYDSCMHVFSFFFFTHTLCNREG